MMKKTILAFLAVLFAHFTFHVSLVQAQDFTVDFETATPQVEGNAIVLDGIRVDGFGFGNENDALKVRFVFNPETLNFELDAENVVTYIDVGVFHEQLMVAGGGLPQPSYTTTDGEVVEVGTEARELTATTDAPFVATFDLQMGDVMSWYFNVKTKDIVYQLSGPDMDLEKTIPAREKVWEPPIKILTPGTYILTVLPLNPEEEATFQFDAFNLNNRAMTLLADGDRVKERFTHTREYAKFQVTLNKGDTLEIPASTDENIAMKLVDKTSHVVANADKGSALSYQQTTGTDDYYLFIYQKNDGKSRYSGKVSVTAEKETKPDKTPKPDNNIKEPDTEVEQPDDTNTEEPLIDDTSDNGEEEPLTDDTSDNGEEEPLTDNTSDNGEEEPLTDNGEEEPLTDDSSDNGESENNSTDDEPGSDESENTSGDETETPEADNPIDGDLDSFFDLLGEQLNN